jgi:chromosome partitioning protein
MSGSIPAILYLNNKGGVGKTTCSSLTAENLALIYKKRVLLIDFDGQMNLTAYWVGQERNDEGDIVPPVHPDYDPEDEYDREFLSERSNICDIFYGKQVLPHSTFIGPKDPDDIDSPRVDLICGNREGMVEIHSTINRNRGDGKEGITAHNLMKRLGEFCADPGLAEQYDVLIIDSGPSETPLFHAAIQASTHIISPYKPEEFSVMGATTLTNAISKARLNRTGRPEHIRFLGLLPCLVDLGRGLHEETMSKVMSEFPSSHFPAGQMITNTTEISRRQEKYNKKPDSIFMLPPSQKVRKRCDPVFAHIYEEVFLNER